MSNPEAKKNILSTELIKYAILTYWSVFWLLNSLDKLIGGPQYLFVGRDRFAQFQKFFASAGMESPSVANVALIITAALELFALVFFTGALIHFVKKNKESARSWFFVGILLTLTIFTIFSIGDHLFGDRFELLEHTLFWFITISSWVVFVKVDQVADLQESIIKKGQLIAASVIALLLVGITSTSIFKHNDDYFFQRTEGVTPVLVGENTYKCVFPFLGGSTSFEKTIETFKVEYPDKRIKQIYTAPNELRLKKADGLIMYILTEDKQ